MKVIILGSGGHASVLIEALRVKGILPFGITDPAIKGKCGDIPIIGNDDEILTMNQLEVHLVNGLGNRATRSNPGLGPRSKLYQRFAERAYVFPVVVHPSATVARSAFVGNGTQVMAGAIIQPSARIMQNVIVNTRAVVEHDCRIGPHCHIAPGAVLCGGAKIGEGSHIGAGAIVLGGVYVGKGSVVAAGAVVTTSLEAGSFADRRFEDFRKSA